MVWLLGMYILNNEIKYFLFIINHQQYLAMCIVIHKQYKYNVRYKYLDLERRQSYRTHFMSFRMVKDMNVSLLHYILYLGASNLNVIIHVNKWKGHQYSWFVLLHIKCVHRDKIYIVVSYGQYWIIYTNTNHLYKKNTHLIPKN
jgi:hypothetical protein